MIFMNQSSCSEARSQKAGLPLRSGGRQGCCGRAGDTQASWKGLPLRSGGGGPGEGSRGTVEAPDGREGTFRDQRPRGLSQQGLGPYEPGARGPQLQAPARMSGPQNLPFPDPFETGAFMITPTDKGKPWAKRTAREVGRTQAAGALGAWRSVGKSPGGSGVAPRSPHPAPATAVGRRLQTQSRDGTDCRRQRLKATGT